MGWVCFAFLSVGDILLQLAPQFCTCSDNMEEDTRFSSTGLLQKQSLHVYNSLKQLVFGVLVVHAACCSDI